MAIQHDPANILPKRRRSVLEHKEDIEPTTPTVQDDASSIRPQYNNHNHTTEENSVNISEVKLLDFAGERIASRYVDTATTESPGEAVPFDGIVS